MGTRLKRGSLRILLLALIAGLLAVQPAVPVNAAHTPQQVRFENLDTTGGLSNNIVWAILQDRRGFIWLGTDNGLNRYDGFTFKVYRRSDDHPGSLSANRITSLYEDREGTLWVGTSAGLDRFDPETETFQHYPAGELSVGPVLAMLEDRSGRFWVGTENRGLALFNRSTGEYTFFRHNPAELSSISNDSVTSLLETSDGQIWVGTRRGLNLFDPGSASFYRYYHNPENPLSLSSNRILQIVEDSERILWVATEDGGLNRFDRSTGAFTRLPVADNNSFAISSNTVQALLADQRGDVWIATRRGLDHYSSATDVFTHYRHDPNDERSLASNEVISLYEDRSGVLWVGTYGAGVSKYNRYANKFTIYEPSGESPYGLSDAIVHAVYDDSAGTLWVGTMDGGLNRINRQTGEVRVFRHQMTDPSSLSSDDVRAILQDSTGVLWVGTSGGGLNRLNTRSETFAQYKHSPSYPNSLSDNIITVLYEDSRHNLWVGTRFGGLDRFNHVNGTFIHHTFQAADPFSLSDNHVRAIAEDGEGTLWVGTGNGLNRMDLETRQFMRFFHDPANPDTIASSQINALLWDPDGCLWIGLNLAGLDRLDLKTMQIRHYTERDGLPNDTVNAIVRDDEGFLWLSTNRGLSRFDPKTETFRNYDLEDGLPGNEFNPGAAFRNAQGDIYFGGLSGLIAFHPATLAANPNPPPVVITAYKEFNQVVAENLKEGQEIELPYSVNFISFEFVSLDFNAPAKNQYAYKLEGFDRDWVEAGNRRYVNYTNLQGGNYVFRVRGSNNDGVWNEAGASIRLRVIPPFWQTWWFISLLAVALGGSVWGVYYLRMKSMETLNRNLEQQVRERTLEIERRREVAEGLREILAILNSNRPLQESLEYIISQIVRLMQADAAIILEKNSECVEVLVSNLAPEELAHFGDCVPGWAAEKILDGETLQVEEVGEYLSQHPELESSLLNGERALLGFPMSIGSSVDGGLLLMFNQPRRFSEEDLKTGFSFADQATLAIANARLRAHAEGLAVSAERSRLARDLHDAVTQTLFATSIIAEVLPAIWERNPEEGRKRLQEISELTRGALAEMRTLLLELRPAALLNTPVDELLQQLCEAFQGRRRIPVEFTADDDLEALPPEVQVVFYRVAQEAFNNIAKHANASQVWVSLTCAGSQVVLQVKDNGVGFNPDRTPSGHLGLAIMRERAQTVGAALDLQSAPGQGTLVRLSWQDGNGAQPGPAEQKQETIIPPGDQHR